MAVHQMNFQRVAGALLSQHLDGLDGIVEGAGTARVDDNMHQIGVALVHIAPVNFHPLQLGDGGGGGHAGGGAHHLIELVVGHVPALQILLAVQIDGEPNDLNAIAFCQLNGNIRAGIRQKSDLAHCTSSLHS